MTADELATNEDNLKPGEIAFDMLGRPIGIISEVTDDDFRALRRGTFSLQAGVPDAARGRVIDSGEGWAVVEIGEAECEP